MIPKGQSLLKSPNFIQKRTRISRRKPNSTKQLYNANHHKRVRSKQGKDPITQLVTVKLLEPLDLWTLVEGGGLRWKNSVFAASNLIHPAYDR